jgi:hypothetical protein
MKIKYNKLGEISVKHTYYETSIARDFRFLSLFNTADLLNRNGIRIRPLPREGTIEFHINDDYAKQAAITWQQDPVHLFFAFNFTDPYFLSYTDLPLRSPLLPKQIQITGAQEVYFFSNATANLGNNTIVDKTDRVLFVPPAFRISYPPAEVSGDKIIIRKLNSVNSITEIPLDTSLTTANKNVEVSLPDEDFQIEEQYEIIIGNLDPVPFRKAPGPLNHIHFGIVQLTLGKAGKAMPFINTSSSDPILQPESYSIRFNNRSVKWQYNIISDQHKAEEFDILSIDLNQNGNSRSEILRNISAFAQNSIPHQIKEDRVLSNGQKAMPILLNDPIPLSEKQEKIFILKVNKSGEEPANIILPVASGNAKLQALSKDDEDNGYLTDIFVYY